MSAKNILAGALTTKAPASTAGAFLYKCIIPFFNDQS